MQISEFIDNSITALMGVPNGHPRVVDVYMGREKLKDRRDGLSVSSGSAPATLSYIAVVDSGRGMKGFEPIATRGQVPKRATDQVRSLSLSLSSEHQLIHRVMRSVIHNTCPLSLCCNVSFLHQQSKVKPEQLRSRLEGRDVVANDQHGLRKRT